MTVNNHIERIAHQEAVHPGGIQLLRCEIIVGGEKDDFLSVGLFLD